MSEVKLRRKEIKFHRIINHDPDIISDRNISNEIDIIIDIEYFILETKDLIKIWDEKHMSRYLLFKAIHIYLLLTKNTEKNHFFSMLNHISYDADYSITSTRDKFVI